MSKRLVCCPVLVALVIAAAPAAAQQAVKLPARDVALKDRPVNVFSVGTVEGRDWEMFSQVRAVAFDRSDNTYLLDGQNLRVIVFDARGRYLRQFGKRGGGPGELQAPLGMEIAPDGNVVVTDVGNRAFIVFTPQGEHVRNVSFSDDLGFPMNGTIDARGNIIARSMPRIRRDGGQPAQADNFSPIFRQPLGSGEVQTLYRVPVTPPQIVEQGGTSNRRVMSISMDPVFGARASFGTLPTGLALHHTSDYEIKLLDADGRHVRSITRDIKPRKVTKKDQDAWLERRREAERNGTGGGTFVISSAVNGAAATTSVGAGSARGGAASAMSMDNVPFAETMSVLSSIRTDPAGRIWAQRRHDDGTNDGPIDLLAADGRYIGTLPPQALPRAVSASGLAAWVETDDLGVEKVVVRRLPATWR